MYFYDCLETLNNILVNGEALDTSGAVIQAYDRECMSKLEVLVDVVATDIRQCVFDIRNLSDYNCNFVEIMKRFIEHIRDCHLKMGRNEKSQTLVALCNVLLHDLNDKVNSAIESYKAKLKATSAVTILEIRCFSAVDFPNGDNRVLEIRSDISLIELVLQVENRYQMSPITLLYLDENNEQITIDSDMVLKKAVHMAYSQALDKSKAVLRLIVGVPVTVEKTDLDISMFKNSQPNIMQTDFFGNNTETWTNLAQKESLLYSLQMDTGFSLTELDKIYSAFSKITHKRLVHKETGYVTLPEFTEIMKVAIKNDDLINEIFNAMDRRKSGKIDFTEFVYGISVLQHGSIEERLKFAFLAYDVDHNDGIDKKELFMLLKSSFDVKGTKTTNAEISKMVDNVFEKYDLNNDGNLSIMEFKSAVLSQAILLNPFWMNVSFKFGGGSSTVKSLNSKSQFVNEIICIKCGRGFIPGLSGEKYCNTCRKLGSPFSTAKYSKI